MDTVVDGGLIRQIGYGTSCPRKELGWMTSGRCGHSLGLGARVAQMHACISCFVLALSLGSKYFASFKVDCAKQQQTSSGLYGTLELQISTFQSTNAEVTGWRGVPLGRQAYANLRGVHAMQCSPWVRMVTGQGP